MQIIKSFTCLVILVCVSTHIQSQTDEIQAIRKIYNETKATYSDEDYPEVTRLDFGRMMPGTGPSNTIVNFYGYEKLPEEEEYQRWYIDGEKVLQFASVHYNVSVREVDVEYLFHPESQELLFYYRKDLVMDVELRYYYKDNKLIKLVTNTIEYVSDEEYKKSDVVEKTGQFSVDELKAADEVLAKAKEYKLTYSQLYKFEKIEKRNN